MSEPLPSAEEAADAVDACCPCKQTPCCQGGEIHTASWWVCECYGLHVKAVTGFIGFAAFEKCRWPGHAAIRRLRQAARQGGRREMAREAREHHRKIMHGLLMRCDHCEWLAAQVGEGK